MNIPIVKPINEIKYEFKQSKYANVPKVPFRAIVFGPSGSGKSVLLVSLILDIYKDVFQRVFVFSPSVDHDSIWLPVKNMYRTISALTLKKNNASFLNIKSEDLMKIIDTQTKITKYLKEQRQKKLYNILVILDDIADAPDIARHNKLLQSLYVRGRHAGIFCYHSIAKGIYITPSYQSKCYTIIYFSLKEQKRN